MLPYFFWIFIFSQSCEVSDFFWTLSYKHLFLELSPDPSFFLHHVRLLSLCDYGSGYQSYAHDLNNHSSNSPSLHSEMISPFYPDPSTTSFSLRCIILTVAVLKHFKGCVSSQALGISSQKVTGCPWLAFMQVMSHLKILMTAELHKTGLLKTFIKLEISLSTTWLLPTRE